MTRAAERLAEQLLEAQVAHHVAELTGPGGAEVLGEVAGAVVTAVRDVPVGALVAPGDATATLLEVLARIGPSPAIAAMVTDLAAALRDLPAHAEHRVGDLVDRAHVEQVVAEVAASQHLRDELLRRLGDSPTLAAIAMRFVSALVGDAVQQNRQRAEKVPGVKLAFGVGDFAARQARGLAPKQLEDALGGAADKGAQAAMERVTRAMVDTMDTDTVAAAAMEVWDLHARDRVAGLRAYLSDAETDAIAEHAHAAWVDVHATPWFRAVVAAVVDAFHARHGDVPLGTLLDDLGIDDEALGGWVRRHGPALVGALHRDGRLHDLLRARLAPFHLSPATIALIDAALA